MPQIAVLGFAGVAGR